MGGTITTPTKLEAAERAIRRLAEELTAQLRAKVGDQPTSQYGEEPYVDLWIGRPRRVTAFVHGPRNCSFTMPTLAEAVAAARDFIADLPDPNACDPWFRPGAPAEPARGGVMGSRAWFAEFERALSRGVPYHRAGDAASDALRNRPTLADRADDARKRQREEGPKPLCRNGLPGEPPARSLDEARADLERRGGGE